MSLSHSQAPSPSTDKYGFNLVIQAVRLAVKLSSTISNLRAAKSQLHVRKIEGGGLIEQSLILRSHTTSLSLDVQQGECYRIALLKTDKQIELASVDRANASNRQRDLAEATIELDDAKRDLELAQQLETLSVGECVGGTEAETGVNQRKKDAKISAQASESVSFLPSFTPYRREVTRH